jgi:hypothetical protein
MTSKFFLLFLALATLPLARAEDPPPTAEEIMKLVRLSYALQDSKSTGTLRDDKTGRSETFTLNMEQNIIRFRFNDPNQIVHLDLGTTPASLKSVQEGGTISVPLEKYGDKVRKFAMNYEDLSMRFLYWPNPTLLKGESIKFQKCWRVRVTNPDRITPYGTVDLWVHQASGGVAKMEAYDFQSNLVKQFQVTQMQKVDGVTLLDTMKIESYDPGTKKTNGRTYMKLDPPVRD